MSEDIDELVSMNRTDIDGLRIDTTLLGVVQEEREVIYEDDDLLTEDELDFDSDNNEIDEEIVDDDLLFKKTWNRAISVEADAMRNEGGEPPHMNSGD
ncbi:hypothetical protein Taro_037573 [Colocasia esculenta]|uniref:Uncharacterized protein n=1 Tax=Colocasia esculenta TaxID=4460 RepID=A0A843WA52_COLES|nr:hypothetical protein [Colocasia esculenta]